MVCKFIFFFCIVQLNTSLYCTIQVPSTGLVPLVDGSSIIIYNNCIDTFISAWLINNVTKQIFLSQIIIFIVAALNNLYYIAASDTHTYTFNAGSGSLKN